MANEQQVQLLKRGANVWNEWRKSPIGCSDPDLIEANLSGTNLSEVNLSRADLRGANLTNANLIRANLFEANLRGANLLNANLSGANAVRACLGETNLTGANLFQADFWDAGLWKADLSAIELATANFSGANLSNANLTKSNFTGAGFHRTDLQGANLTDVNLTKANLTRANLSEAHLIRTNLSQAKLSYCRIYGLSAWDIKGIPEMQENLIITPTNEAEITVDDLEIAQFIYLLLKNEKLKNIIDTITSKAVLILGRFTGERKAILDAIRVELRRRNFTPILFDFDKPNSKDTTSTIETLARMARFIIADLTDPSSIPHELATIIPFLRSTPVLPIRLQGSEGYSMFKDLQRSYQWVLETHEYKDGQLLIDGLSQVIAPANEMAESFRIDLSKPTIKN